MLYVCISCVCRIAAVFYTAAPFFSKFRALDKIADFSREVFVWKHGMKTYTRNFCWRAHNIIQ